MIQLRFFFKTAMFLNIYINVSYDLAIPFLAVCPREIKKKMYPHSHHAKYSWKDFHKLKNSSKVYEWVSKYTERAAFIE